MNLQSPEWHEVAAEIDRRVSEMDKTNRGPRSLEETASLRGGISALLALKNHLESAALPEESELRFS